jgi:predicted signal transduction protein with EAL and GGDEF domain/FixJ family two-component response regulator
MSGTRARILFADDDATALLIAQAALEAGGYEVSGVGDGDSAVTQFAQHPADCLVLDIMMPGKNGYEACQAIRAMPAGKDVPILILTSRDDVESVARAYESGATDFATKGISGRLLVERVRFLLREHSSRRALVVSRSRLHMVQNMARVGHWEVDGAGRTLHMSSLVQSLLYDSPPASSHFGQLVAAVRPADGQSVLRAFRGWQDNGKSFRLETRLRSGQYLHIQGAATPAGDGKRGRNLTLAVQDITALREAQREAHRLANFDTLTGLPNRQHLLDTVAGQMRASGASKQMAVMCFRLAGIERLQQSLGQHACDAVFVAAAQMILGATGHNAADAFAHLGNGEFVLSRPEIGSPSVAAEIADEVARAFAAPMSGDGWTTTFPVSAGIAMWPADGDEASVLLEKARATAAMGMNSTESVYRFFTADIHDRARRAMVMESALHGALERGELTLAYQPRIRLQDRMIIGVEALMRWQHPELGHVSPGEFIPIAEDAGLIGALGTWALQEACRQTAEWRRSTGRGLAVSVNVAAHQLRTPRKLASDIGAALAASELPASALEIELTESMVIEASEEVHAVLQELRQLGVSIALDDFGTGYSSLAYLRQLRVDCLKIDRSFVQDLSHNDTAERVLLAILGIASALRLRAIAEGVETQAQLEILERHDCPEAQGYLFARPMEPKALEKMLMVPAALDPIQQAHCA